MKEILREVGMIARCFESISNIEFKDYKLSKNQYIYLVRIAENPGIILERLCDLVKVDRSTASRSVKKLHKDGFVDKIDINGTGKKIKLYPSSKGNVVFKMLQNDEAYSNTVALEGFSKDELTNLLNYLVRIRTNIEKDWEIVKSGGTRPYRKIHSNDYDKLIDDRMQIIDYEDRYHEMFKEISYDWLKEYVSIEPIDELMVNNPQKEIIDKGGYIWLAREGNHILGTISLIKVNSKTYEIAKLGVRKGFRNNGIGTKLMLTAIMKSYNLNATKIILYTTKKLDKALSLYERYGFKYVEDAVSKYEEADIKMELNFD